MVDLPRKKVGIVCCSGEELAEGTVSRLASLKVLEDLRATDTVTICLPLFLAGGEGDRAFARYYPTIAVDGCELRCAARGTEMYSSKPAASVVVRDLLAEKGFGPPQGRRSLNAEGLRAVDVTAEHIVGLVDELRGKAWDRRAGAFIASSSITTVPAADEVAATDATCACGSGIPVQKVQIGGEEVTLVALPLIFAKAREVGKPPSDSTASEMLEAVRIYNAVAAGVEAEYVTMLQLEYAKFCEKKPTSR